MSRWPQYLIERARRTPPPDCCVVPASTPVVSFGDPVVPKVATLGINPSSSEFLARNGSLLVGKQRRLATLESLRIGSWAELGDAAAAAIVDDCARYFHVDGNPYLRWFKPLENVLRGALGVSYFDGSANHLDLVQWATRPIWGQLDNGVQARLLSADLPFLEHQLSAQSYRVVIVNGKTAIDWVQRAGLVTWTEVQRLTGPPSARIYIGSSTTPRFIGWSCNLQSQHGALRLAPELTAVVAAHGRRVLHGDGHASEGRST